jgi:hypothetical protein
MKGKDLCQCGECLICNIVKVNHLEEKEMKYQDTDSILFEK